MLKKIKKYLSSILSTLLILCCCPTGAVETLTFFHNDAAGTPLVATDASGNVLWKENYRPYGDKLNNQSGSSANKIGFAGKAYDSNTGLSYMGARYYDGVIGRFTGVDPKGLDPTNIHSVNRYTYANNNPYKFIDPDGKNAILAFSGSIAVFYMAASKYANEPQARAVVDRMFKGVANVFRSDSADVAEPNSEPDKGQQTAPPSLSPEGSGRRGAFDEAKRGNGVPTSQSPDRVKPNEDKRGNRQPGRSYEFDVPKPGGGTRTVEIRDDAAGHNYGDGNAQNRGPHFNDAVGNHYDY